MNHEEFAKAFHSRTVSYHPAFRADRRPVVIEIGDDAHNPAGHALAVALANLLSRVHQRLIFAGDLERPLLICDPFGATTLERATVGTATRINPTIDVEAFDRGPELESLTSIAIGEGCGDLQLGAEGWLATVGEQASPSSSASSHWGAMLAACLGSHHAFRRLLDRESELESSYSLWEFGRAHGAQGPEDASLASLGRVMQVGAGGVGAAFAYWLALLGGQSPLDLLIVDGDEVEVSNLNRQLIFLAADAGFGSSGRGNKAELAAQRLEAAHASPHWYGDDSAVVNGDYDLVLALANERGVRQALQDRRPPALLHATTSANYQAQFHRHLPEIDDCIRCRLPEAAPSTECAGAEIPIPNSDDSADAALPFLSGAAGLMLAAACARMAHADLATRTSNLTTVDFGGAAPVANDLRLRCRQGCPRYDAA